MVSRLIAQLKHSDAVKQAGLVFSGNTLASAIAAIAIILYSRLLGPENFGIFSVGFSFILLLSRLGDGGVNVALQKYLSQTFEQQKDQARGYVRAATKYKVIITLGIVVLITAAVPYLASSWLGTDRLDILYLSIIFAVINIAYDYLATIHQSILQFQQSVFMNLIQAVLKTVGAAIMWLVGQSSVLIAFALYSISPLIGVVYAIRALPGWLASPQTISDKSKFSATLRGTMNFTAIAVIAGAIGENIDVLMVRSFLSDFETGLYGAGSRLAILVSIVGYSLGAVLSPRVARYNQSHMQSYLRKGLLASVVLILGSFVLIPFTHYLIVLTAGSQYLAATTAVNYLLIAAMIAAATAPLVAVFYAVDNPSYFAVAGVIEAGLLIGANLILIPSLGIEGAGMAKLIMRSVILVVTVAAVDLACRKAYGMGLLKMLSAPKVS